MSNSVMVPSNFGAVSSVFGSDAGTNDELGAGVASSYGIMGYKGKVWSIRYQGNTQTLMRDDGDGPRNSIEVVLVKASPAISKIFYKQGYVDGSNEAPDCWSSNGQVPDGSVQNKVSQTCTACPMNAWGSRITESGKQGKACSDSRRVAIVPAADIGNELYGGPMLLRVPAATLKDLKAYGDTLNSYQYPYYAAVTRISFDPNEAYPKFMFSAVRPLTDAEARQVMELREDPRVGTVLNEALDAPMPAPAAAAPPASPFEQDNVAPQGNAPAQAPAQQPAQAAAQSAQGGGGFGPAVAAEEPAAQPAQQPAHQPAQQPAPKAEAQPKNEQAGNAAPSNDPAPSTAQAAPEGFDALLDQLLNT